MRFHALKAVCAALLLCLNAANAAADPVAFDIPAQEAASAVQQLARQSDLQIFALSKDVQDVWTNPIKGDYEPLEALERLLAGTPLTYVASGNQAITIRRADNPAPSETEFAGKPLLPAGALTPSWRQTWSGRDEIIVTGSRLKREGLETLQTVIVTEGEDFQHNGATNVGEALEKIPGFGVSDSNAIGGQATFGVGQTFIDFFGLGSQRTLTLVNGRRFVSSNTISALSTAPAGQQVDLNLIPVNLIDRVETITIGGAPVYGSDAIGGTVNIILKDHYEGVQAFGQYGLTERGDTAQTSLRLLTGAELSGGRGGVILSAEYNQRDGLLESDRSFLRHRPFLAANPADTGPDDGIPSQIILQDQVLSGVTDSGIPLPPGDTPGGWVTPDYPNGFFIFNASGQPVQFAPGGALAPYDLGSGGGDMPVFVSGGDGLRVPEYFSLLAPTERILVNGLGRYRVTQDVNAFLEVSTAHTKSEEIREFLAINSAVIPQGGAIPFSTDNPFLQPEARRIIEANGLTRFRLSRNLSDLLDPNPGSSKLDLFRIVGGLEGEFSAFGERWNWDISYNHGRSENRSTIPYILDDNFYAAVDAVRDPLSGDIVCADRSRADCVPLNLFGENAASAAAVDYVTETGNAESINQQDIFTANLGGDIPVSAAGPLNFNIGAETRREYASFRPDTLLKTNNNRTPTFVEVAGGFETTELYGEAGLPLIAADQNMAFIEEMSIEGAVRWVGNSLSESDVTWTAGGRVTPRLPDPFGKLVLRGVFTHAIRAPTISELFLTASPSRVSATDPCDQRFYRAGLAPALREANCRQALAALGAPAPEDFESGIDAISITGTTQGNPDLGNERADSWSLGAVYRPQYISDLRITADWINVHLKNGIELLSLTQMLSACYDSPQYPAVPACAGFTRASDENAGQVVDFQSSFYNTADLEFAGLIAAIDYRLELADWTALARLPGAIRVSGKFFYIDHFRTRGFTGGPLVETAGTLGAPDIEGLVSLGYETPDFDISVRTRWTGSVKLDSGVSPELVVIGETGDYFLTDITLGHELWNGGRIQLVIDNVADAAPPYGARLAASTISRRSYDVLGRRFLLSLTTEF